MLNARSTYRFLPVLLAVLAGACAEVVPTETFDTLSVTTSALDMAVEGSAYSQTLSAEGGDGSYTWSVSAGSLPGGLSLSAAGVVSGTPGATGSTFTIQVTSGDGQTATRELSIDVEPLLEVTTTELADVGEGAAYDGMLAATGGDGSYAWTLVSGDLPEGLSLDASGDITGTATTQEEQEFTVEVASGEQVAQATLSIAVVAPPEIDTDPTAVQFARPLGSANPAPKTVMVENAGVATLFWTASADGTWVTLSAAEGETAGGAASGIEIGVDADGLATGTHTATVEIVGEAPADTPETINVTLVVTSELPLLGRSDPLATASSHSPNFLLGTALRVDVATTLTHLALIGHAAGPQYKLALYRDEGGQPTELLALTSAAAMAVGVLETQVAPVALPVGNYWIMGIFSTTGSVGVDYSGDREVKYIGLNFANPIPTAFPEDHLTYYQQEFNYYIRVSDPQNGAAVITPSGATVRPPRAAPATATATSPPGR